jgi:hypothetical protein
MAEFDPLTKLMKEVLGDKVKKVVGSSRLASLTCKLPTSCTVGPRFHEPYQGCGIRTLPDFQVR